jgi:DNA-binding GntR family transcriptional regulator
LLDALRQGEEAKAEALVKEHIVEFQQNIKVIL